MANKSTERIDPVQFTDLIEATDFLAAHIPALTVKQRLVLSAWGDGETFEAIAARQGVTAEAIKGRFDSAIRRLRQLAGIEPAKENISRP